MSFEHAYYIILYFVEYIIFKKSHKQFVQSGIQMVTHDALKVLKLHSGTPGSCDFDQLKASFVTMNPELHSHSCNFLYIYCTAFPLFQFLIKTSAPIETNKIHCLNRDVAGTWFHGQIQSCNTKARFFTLLLDNFLSVLEYLESN